MWQILGRGAFSKFWHSNHKELINRVWGCEDSQGLTSLMRSHYYVQMLIFVELKSSNCYHALAFLILGFKASLGTMAAPECTLLPRLFPLDETHLDVMRGLILKKISTSASTRRARRSNTTTFVRIHGSSYLLWQGLDSKLSYEATPLRSVWRRSCVAYDVARIESNAWSISGMWRLTIWKQNKTLVKLRLGPLLALEQDKVARWKSLVLHFEVAMKAPGRKYQFFSTTSLICSLKSQMFHAGWM